MNKQQFTIVLKKICNNGEIRVVAVSGDSMISNDNGVTVKNAKTKDEWFVPMRNIGYVKTEGYHE